MSDCATAVAGILTGAMLVTAIATMWAIGNDLAALWTSCATVMWAAHTIDDARARTGRHAPKTTAKRAETVAP